MADLVDEKDRGNILKTTGRKVQQSELGQYSEDIAEIVGWFQAKADSGEEPGSIAIGH